MYYVRCTIIINCILFLSVLLIAPDAYTLPADHKDRFIVTAIEAAERQNASQKEIIIQSCFDNNPKYFPNIKHFKEMCSALQLVDAAPHPPEGWLRDTINWRIKFNQNDSGFKEMRENDGIYKSYGIFPFVKYSDEIEQKKVYIYGTVSKKYIEHLAKQFFDFYEKFVTNNPNANPDMLAPDILYRIGSEKRSVFNIQKTYKMVNIYYVDKAYFVLYTEGLTESELQYFMRQIDYHKVALIHDLSAVNPLRIDPDQLPVFNNMSQ